MTLTMRMLPLITVAALLITLVLPILDSGNDSGPTIVVSSLGGEPLDLTEVRPEFVIIWIAVLGCALSVWLLRSHTWWAIVTIIVATLWGILLISMLLDPPSVIWDGVDDQGRPTGGYEVGEPAAGALVWAVGIGALVAAGVCGLIRSQVDADGRQIPPRRNAVRRS